MMDDLLADFRCFLRAKGGPENVRDSELVKVLAETAIVEMGEVSLSTDQPDDQRETVQDVAQRANGILYDRLREDLLRRLSAKRKAGASLGELIEEAQNVLLAHVDPLALLLSESELAAWLTGAGGVARQLPAWEALDQPEATPSLPPEFTFETLPTSPGHWEWEGSDIWLPLVEEASRDLRERQLFSKEEFDVLADSAKSRAFTTAYAKSEEALSKIRDSLVDSVEQGLPYQRFRDVLADDLETSTVGPGEVENIYRTNIGQAFSNGAEVIGQHEIVRDEFPYRERLNADDSRQTALCHTLSKSGINGTAIYRADDPVWRKFRPLSHWNCRCVPRLMSIEDAARRGIKEAREWLRTGEPPAVPHWVDEPDVELPNGWVPGGGLDLSVRHAPHTMTIAGKEYKGGEFIPDEAWDKASEEEKAKVDGKMERFTPKVVAFLQKSGIQSPEQFSSLQQAIRPAKPSDLKKESINLWHGTTKKAASKIIKDGSLKEGDRGINASADVVHASQYPEEYGSESLILLSAKVGDLDIDPNDQQGETIKENLFPHFGSSATVGKHSILAVIDLPDSGADAVIASLKSGKLWSAIRGGAKVRWLNQHA